MSSLFALALSTHIIAGVIGVIVLFVVVLTLLSKSVNIKKLQITASLAALSFYLSWFSGGYYYWKYYGDNVKPVIKDGDFPWAHLVVMEAKEHIFLLLPVMSLLLVGFAFFSKARLLTDESFKKSVAFFALSMLVLAVLITLAGIVISGGAQ